MAFMAWVPLHQHGVANQSDGQAFDLKGLAGVPGIAGRSPSYLARQMYDIQAGTRRGEWSALMKPVVEKLTEEDFVAIAAYVSSRTP